MARPQAGQALAVPAEPSGLVPPGFDPSRKKLDHYEEYWREAVMIAFEEVGGDINVLTSVQWDEIARGLRTSQECMSDAFYQPENPMIRRNERLSARLKWTQELEGCGECGGSGRLEYSAGPWWVNTECHACHGAGKVHPRGEREPQS